MPLDPKKLAWWVKHNGGVTCAARLSDISHQRISEMLRGRRIAGIRLDVVERLAAALGATPEQLLTRPRRRVHDRKV